MKTNKIIRFTFIMLAFQALFSCKKEEKIGVSCTEAFILPGLQITISCQDITTLNKSIFFPNSKTGFITGYDGKIIRTDNGGETWTNLLSGTTLPLFQYSS